MFLCSREFNLHDYTWDGHVVVHELESSDPDNLNIIYMQRQRHLLMFHSLAMCVAATWGQTQCKRCKVVHTATRVCVGAVFSSFLSNLQVGGWLWVDSLENWPKVWLWAWVAVMDWRHVQGGIGSCRMFIIPLVTWTSPDLMSDEELHTFPDTVFLSLASLQCRCRGEWPGRALVCFQRGGELAFFGKRLFIEAFVPSSCPFNIISIS